MLLHLQTLLNNDVIRGKRRKILAEQQARSTGDWSTARMVRDALAQLDRTVYLRLEIVRAFAAPEETS